MDKGQLKAIEMQLAGQVQEQMSEFVEVLQLSASPLNPEQVVSSTAVSAESHENQATPEEAETLATQRQLSGLTTVVADEVVIEEDRSKLYEKFVREGRDLDDPKLKNNERQLLDILEDIEPAAKSQTMSEQNPSRNLVTPQSAPVVNIDFDESMLLELDEEDDEDFDEQSYEDDEEQSEDSEETEDELLALKETDPGYFRSIVTKI